MNKFLEKAKDDFVFEVQNVLDTLCQNNYIIREDVAPGTEPKWKYKEKEMDMFQVCSYLEKILIDRQLADSFQSCSDALLELEDLKYILDAKMKFLAQRIIEKF